MLQTALFWQHTSHCPHYVAGIGIINWAEDGMKSFLQLLSCNWIRATLLAMAAVGYCFNNSTFQTRALNAVLAAMKLWVLILLFSLL